ncbi:RpiB/LacA/LacB family sugar-phosphate isomerase, partial [Streptococcus anginosus]|nr:RpiB/LacA/LacB family sugar-phosphate isomerase [Streptococcus anginosus]
MGFRVVVLGDSAGYGYKDLIKADLEKDDRIDEVIDLGLHEGESALYPNLATAGAEMIARGEADRGIFICGTGMGVAMSANKVKGIRASTAHDSFSV